MLAILFVMTLGATNDPKIERLLDAIEQVETGGEKNPDDAVGDGGRSRGRYQISLAYAKDARTGLSAGEYARNVRSREWSRRTVVLFWTRYAKSALDKGDAERLARIHNGGPRGASKRATLPYWRKVEKEMKK